MFEKFKEINGIFFVKEVRLKFVQKMVPKQFGNKVFLRFRGVDRVFESIKNGVPVIPSHFLFFIHGKLLNGIFVSNFVWLTSLMTIVFKAFGKWI